MEEPLEVRYAFMMLLAMCDATGHVIGTDIAIARRMNMPLEEFRKCAEALSQPDPDSNSREEEGRRIIPSDNERGYLVVNYLTYRDMKTEESKRDYMREYMRKRREREALANGKTPVKRVSRQLACVKHAEAEGELTVEGEKKELRSCAEPQAVVALMIFPVHGKLREWPLTQARVSGWQESFPALDVLKCCREARQWCVDNPTKQKTTTGMPAFLGRWMSKAQNGMENMHLPFSPNGRNGAHQTEAQRDQQKTGLPPQEFNLKRL